MTARKYYLADLTGDEAREALAGNPVILLPLGSHEDQGPHAPMGDYLCADRMALRIAERATAQGTPTYIAPVLPFGGADYFGSMKGGIALGQATLRAVLRDMFDCLLRHDLTRLIVLNGHGGNVQAVHEVTQAIRLDRNVTIPSLYLWSIAYAMLPEIMGDADTARQSAGHGGNPLTSIAMALVPELMRPDLIPAPAPTRQVLGLPVSGFSTVLFQNAAIHLPLEVDEIATKGVLKADPRLCSADTGAALVERLTTLTVGLIDHLATQGW